jgi:hypothetical protein
MMSHTYNTHTYHVHTHVCMHEFETDGVTASVPLTQRTHTKIILQRELLTGLI